uniref:J domain-containing protein n=1 Tax=Globodera pallida TaxID=36090 RepID=A0A183CAN8_GLOPA
MLEYHTDKNPDGAVMSEAFSKAKETLTDPRSRAFYDEHQRSSGGGRHSGDYDEMSKPPEFPTFTAMLKNSNCEDQLKQFTGAEIEIPLKCVRHKRHTATCAVAALPWPTATVTRNLPLRGLKDRGKLY